MTLNDFGTGTLERVRNVVVLWDIDHPGFLVGHGFVMRAQTFKVESVEGRCVVKFRISPRTGEIQFSHNRR